MERPGSKSSDPDAGFSWRRVTRLFRPHRRQVTVVLVVVFATSLLGVVNPVLIRVLFDQGLFPNDAAGPDLGLLVGVGVTMLVISLVTGALSLWQTWLTNNLGQRVLRQLRQTVYRHLQSLSLSFYASARTGDLQTRISSDVGGVQNAVTQTLSSILANVVTVVAAVIAMSVLSWQLTLMSVAAVPLFVWATRRVGERRKQLTGEAQRLTAEMNVITQETLSVSGFTLSRLFGRQDREVARFESTNEQLSAIVTRQQVVGQGFFTVVGTFMGATPVLVYLVAGFLLDGGVDVSAGTIVAVTTLQSRLFFPVTRILETTVELQSSQALFDRIFEYLDRQPDVAEKPGAVELDGADAQGTVEFDDVHFSYDVDADDEVLAGVSFEAGRGQLIAFVGASGSGKSTILNLVPRLYDVDAGSVRLDDHDVRDLSFGSLSGLIGMVTQESYLFADTLRANIAYGLPDATDLEIEKAARAAAIHDRIMDFDDGYDTVVGERGFRLSGGEKQRIAIARVLLHDPPVLVLDEATSALDSMSERRIQEALGELMGGRTTLAVAHRLSTIQAADVIHVVDHGRIVESGTHDQLLELDGAYRALYDEQFGGGEIEAHFDAGVVLKSGRCEFLANLPADERAELLRSRLRAGTKDR